MIDVDPLVEILQANAPQLAAAGVTLAGAFAHWRKTGKLPIGRLPWRTGKQIFRELGDTYFGKPRPKGVPGLVVEETPEDLAGALREAYFESADLYSNQHEGEVYGMRRPSGLRPHPETGVATAMELHPRIFEIEGGLSLVIAHDEASRLEAFKAHVTAALLSWDRGQDMMADVLDEAGLTYERIESERSAGVDVVS